MKSAACQATTKPGHFQKVIESSLNLREWAAACTVAESPAVYRPRHPERTVFYQLFETHFDRYLHAYEERFESRSEPLRPVVVRSVEDLLGCGRPEGGFARIRCPKCRAEHLLAFSCRTRNFCSSCQAKRAVLFVENLIGEILAPVPHGHWTSSIPRALRRLFERDRKLLGLTSQTVYASILKTFRAVFDLPDVRPGCIISLQTCGFTASPATSRIRGGIASDFTGSTPTGAESSQRAPRATAPRRPPIHARTRRIRSRPGSPEPRGRS